MVHTEPDNFYLLLTFIKTCIMKKILLMLASAFFMFSCSQEEGTSPINENTSITSIGNSRYATQICQIVITSRLR